MDTPTPSPSPIDDVSPADETPSADATPKPSLFLSDQQIDDAGLSDCQVGDTYTAKITFRVSSVSDQDDHKNKTLEIQSITDTTPGEGDGTDNNPDNNPDNPDENATDESGGDSALGYDRPPAKEGMPLDIKKLRS